MSEKKKEELFFHNPDAITRITLWANIVAWIILGLTLITFVNQAYSIISNWASIVPTLPPALFDKISAFASLFLDSFAGIFYFLVLRGISVGLNLGLDIFLLGSDDDEIIDEVIVVEKTV